MNGSGVPPVADRVAVWLLRVFTAVVLVYGTADNVFSHARMLEFRDFLQANGFPAPMAAAYLSAYAQFGAGILIGIGLLTRLAASVMVINFVVALVMVHWSLPFSANIAPLAMLVNAVFFTLAGASFWSVDAALRRRRAAA